MRWHIFFGVLMLLVHGCVAYCWPHSIIDSDENTIFVVVHANFTNDTIGDIIEDKFKKLFDACSDSYDFKFIHCDGGTKDTIALRQQYTSSNIIDLNVPDEYKYHNLEEYGLIYAGNNGLKTTYRVFKGIFNEFENNKFSDAGYITESSHDHVKVISDKIPNLPSANLYNFIMSIHYEDGEVKGEIEKCNRISDNITELDIVVVCSDTGANYRDLDYNQLDVWVSNDCRRDIDKFKGNLLAVLSPRPFAIEYELTVPAIFLDTLYLSNEDKTMFLNSLLMKSLRMLRYAFREFMLNADWKRAAIVSDNSWYSIEFEKELIQMFEEENISYIVERCETITCNFTQVFLSLNSISEANVVLANIDKNKVKILFDTYHLMQNNGHFRRKYLWLLRDWQQNTLYNANGAFYITLDQHYEERADEVSKALRHLQNAYAEVTSLNRVAVGRETFYRQIVQLMQDSITNHQETSKGFVYQISKNTWRPISEMDITSDGRVTWNVYGHTPPAAADSSCMIRGNYHKLCDEDRLVTLMLVLVTFAVIVLMISVYFHKSSPIRQLNYSHLN